MSDPNYDQYRIYFDDETSTVLNILPDDEIQDVIIDLCENESWDLMSVVDYSLEN